MLAGAGSKLSAAPCLAHLKQVLRARARVCVCACVCVCVRACSCAREGTSRKSRSSRNSRTACTPHASTLRKKELSWRPSRLRLDPLRLHPLRLDTLRHTPLALTPAALFATQACLARTSTGRGAARQVRGGNSRAGRRLWTWMTWLRSSKVFRTSGLIIRSRYRFRYLPPSRRQRPGPHAPQTQTSTRLAANTRLANDGTRPRMRAALTLRALHTLNVCGWGRRGAREG